MMKKIELFGRRLTIGFEKKEKVKKETKDMELSTREVVNEKVVYLILILVLTVASANTYLFSGYLKLGDVARRDVIAPTEIVYNDRDAKERIVSEILENSQKEYIRIENVEEETIKKINIFFEQIKRNKKIDLNLAYQRINDEVNIEIPSEIFTYLFEKPNDELDNLRDKYLKDIKTLYKQGVKKDGNLLRLNNIFEVIKDLDFYEESFIRTFIKPNYILDSEKTEELLNEKIEQVKNVSVRIKAGSIILKKGEVVSENKVVILKNAGLYGKTGKIVKFMGTLIYLFILSVIFKNICTKFMFNEIRKKKIITVL
jgi:cyclic-di-AMP phosphodiesterase PgpH